MTEKKCRHIAVLGIDGMGNFNRFAETPNMDKLFENGAFTYDALSMNPTISAENWGAMLLGANPIAHGLTNGIVGSHEYTNKELPSLFARIRKYVPDECLISCCNWNPINYGIIEHDIGVEFLTAKTDEDLTPLICDSVAKKPLFMFVQFDDVDGAGHHFTYGSKEHLAQITATDGMLGKVLDAYKDAGIYDDTLFLVIADHGGIRNGHGGYMDSEKYVFLGVSGRDVLRGNIGKACTKDVSAIVLHALGIDIPTYNPDLFSSQVPYGIFADAGKDYFVPEPKPLNVRTKETPDYFDCDGLSAYLPQEKIKLALFFDNNLSDATGSHIGKECGAVKFYSEGVCGSYAEFGKTGHAVYDDVKVGFGSFSVALWLKIDRSLIEAPALCANKDWWWQNRRGRGFALSLRCADTVFNIGTGDDDFDFVTPFPEDVSEGWIHAIFTVDKEKKELSCFYNFKLVHSMALEDNFLCELDSLPFTVGDDGLGQYNCETHNFLVYMDDFLLIDGALSKTEIDSLASYYDT